MAALILVSLVKTRSADWQVVSRPGARSRRAQIAGGRRERVDSQDQLQGGNEVARLKSHAAPSQRGARVMCYRSNGRSGGTPLIAVVESADLRKLDNVAIRRSLNRSFPWGVFAETQVGSGSVVVEEVSGEKAVKMFLV